MSLRDVNSWPKNQNKKPKTHLSSVPSEISCGMCVAHRPRKGIALRRVIVIPRVEGECVRVSRSAYQSSVCRECLDRIRSEIRIAPEVASEVFVSGAARVAQLRG